MIAAENDIRYQRETKICTPQSPSKLEGSDTNLQNVMSMFRNKENLYVIFFHSPIRKKNVAHTLCTCTSAYLRWL